jgi:hypothetical protein
MKWLDLGGGVSNESPLLGEEADVVLKPSKIVLNERKGR